eukprot:1193455-Prorocentrum_minimum.AAC.5
MIKRQAEAELALLAPFLKKVLVRVKHLEKELYETSLRKGNMQEVRASPSLARRVAAPPQMRRPQITDSCTTNRPPPDPLPTFLSSAGEEGGVLEHEDDERRTAEPRGQAGLQGSEGQPRPQVQAAGDALRAEAVHQDVARGGGHHKLGAHHARAHAPAGDALQRAAGSGAAPQDHLADPMCSSQDVTRASMVVKRNEDGLLEAMINFHPILEHSKEALELVRRVLRSLDLNKISRCSQAAVIFYVWLQETIAQVSQPWPTSPGEWRSLSCCAENLTNNFLKRCKSLINR